VLSCIVQEITGMTMFDFLKERLFTPMGIETVQWESCPMGHTKGGWGMYLLPEDMAKLGLLLLQNGTWKGKSLVPADYVAEMTKKQIDSANDEDMFGYGFQTWMGKRPGSFLFNGMLGQNVHVIPDRSMVIVVTGGNDKLFGNCEVNRIIYKYFTDNALPVPTGNKNDYRRLCGVEQMVKNEYACLKPQRMNSVLSALQKMKGKSAIPQDATALGGKSYTLDALNVRFQPLFAQLLSNCYTEGIDRISFMLEGGKFYFLFKEGEIENKIAVGFQNHEYTKISIGGEPYLVAAQGVFAVDEDDTPVLKLAIPFVEHSNGRLIKIFFLDDENIKIEWREFPGKTIIADGAQTLLSSLNDSIMNQVKSRIDIDMLLSMADGIMEPISTGKLLKH
ncbi:MAG: serine hydrolase, partial [Oscillospiraceae bacterium]